MLRLIATTTIAVSAAISMSVTDAQAHKLPVDVSSQLQVATGPDQVALLAVTYPNLAVSIMEEAALLGLSTPAQVVGAAVSSEASPAKITQLTRAAATVAPHQAGSVIASAAELCVATGVEISDEFAPALAAAVVDGVEESGALAEVVESEAAEILAAMQGWCGQSPEDMARVIAAATDDKYDTAEDFLATMNLPGDAGGDDQSTFAHIVTLGDFVSAGQGGAATLNETENNPSPN